MSFIYRHKNKLFIMASILILIPFLLCIALELDEPYTMGLANNGYKDIIKLTAMDIHPPFYYLILKLFLSVTTFWTKNIFVKIIFARLLSTIFSLISFIYLLKTINLFHIKNNKYIFFLLFLLLPFNLGIDQQLAHIRMYSLSIMFISIEIYYILMYIKFKKTGHLIILSSILILSLYTNYFTGIVAGLYYIFLWVLSIVKKELKSFLLLTLFGLFPLIIFIPWVNTLIMQFSISPQGSSSILAIIKYLLSIAIIVTIFYIPFKINKNKENYLLNIFIRSTLATIFAIVIINVITGSESLRYLGPIMVPFMSISLSAISINKNKKYKFIIAIFLACNMSISIYKQFHNFVIPSIGYVQKFHKIELSKDKYISAKKYKINKYYWDYIGGNAIYLKSINKEISDKNYMKTTGPIGNGNPKLFKAVFPNVEHFQTINPRATKNTK